MKEEKRLKAKARALLASLSDVDSDSDSDDHTYTSSSEDEEENKPKKKDGKNFNGLCYFSSDKNQVGYCVMALDNTKKDTKENDSEPEDEVPPLSPEQLAPEVEELSECLVK